MARVTATPQQPSTENLGSKVKAHTRYYDADGTLLPGVTTIVRVLGSNPEPLLTWANNEGLAGRDTRKIKDETATIGSLAHYAVQCQLTGAQPDLTDYTANQAERAQYALNAFQSWRDEHHFVPELIEQHLVSEEHKYGGTIDCWGRLDGQPVLVDFKTSSNVYIEHKIQVGAYWKLLQENGYDVKGVRILRIPRVPDEEFQEHILTGKQVLLAWGIFWRALQIYRLHRELKNGA